MNWKSYFLLIAFLCLTFGSINAQENYNIASINQYYHNWNDGANDVSINGVYAYVACGHDGLRIVDISRPGSFSDVGQYAVNDTNHDYVFAVAVGGNYAYLGTQNDVWVVDISNPENPQTILNLPIAGTKNAIRIAGDYAFVCTWGMSIIDISDPADAQVVWNSDFSWEIDDIDVHGNIAYAAAGEHGVIVLDISEISSPQIIDEFCFADYAWVSGVAVSGNYALLAAGSRGLQVLDLSTMEIATGIDSLSYAFRIKIKDSFAYMTYGNPECPLAVIDISNPASPQTLGIYYPPQDIVNFAVVGDMVYVADFEHGLRLVDVSAPRIPHEEYAYNRYGHDLEVTVKDDYAFVQEDYRIATVNFSNLYHPYEASSLDFIQSIRDLHFVGDVAYVCHQSTTCLEAIDFSDPSSPEPLGSYSSESCQPYFSAIYDHYAYLLGYHGITIVDISDPRTMTEAGNFSITVSNCFLETFDHYAVFQNAVQRIVLLDLSDPLSPTIAGGYDLGRYEYCNQAKVVNDRLYLCCTDKFRIFDISDLQNWELLSETEFSGDPRAYLCRFDIVGSYAYLAVAYRGLCVLDITDGSNPQQVGLYRTPGFPEGIDVTGTMAVVADYNNLGFYDCSRAVGVDEQVTPEMPVAFALLPNYPNPFNSSTTIQFEMPKPGKVSLKIYDILGRDVVTLATHEFAAGRHSIRWDGMAADGKAAASGRYFVRATTDEAVKSIPILLLK
jgi:hypothetical protein